MAYFDFNDFYIRFIYNALYIHVTFMYFYVFKFVSNFINAVIVAVVAYYSGRKISKYFNVRVIFIKSLYRCPNTFASHGISAVNLFSR